MSSTLPPKLTQLLETISNDELTQLAAYLAGNAGMAQLNLGQTKGYQVAVKGGTAYIGDHYQIDVDTLEQVLGRLMQDRQMSEEIDFEGYLTSLVSTYEQWWQLYTLTEAIGQTKEKGSDRPMLFDFGLMVQTVAKKDELGASSQNQRERIEELPVLEGIRKYADGHVLLTGRPGSGKSTALIRLLLEMANQSLQTGKDPIPILVELRYWKTSMLERIRAFLYKHDPHLSLDDTTLATLLYQGRFLLLIDGLNELSSEEARLQLASFRGDYPKVPMIFTTRDLSLGGDLGIEKKLDMQPLTEPQMKAFIRAYVPEQAEAMLRQLSDRLREFGQTPLLLWMLCEVYQQSPDHQIPSNLAGVFRAFTDMYEISSVRKHTVALLKGDVSPLSDRRLWKEALKALALVMMQGETPVDFRVAIHRDEAEAALNRIFPDETFPVRDVLDDLLKYHLLQNRSADQIEFRHQLIQEYYVAEYLLKLLPKMSDEQLKRDYLNYLKWTEPIALMLALMDEEAQALRVVKLALDDVDLALGARLAGQVKPSFQTTTIGLIDTLEIVPLLKCRLWETSHSGVAISRLLNALDDPDLEVRWNAVYALGVIRSKEAILSLLKLLNSKEPEPELRQRIAKTLGEIGHKKSVTGLLKGLNDSDSSVCREVARVLGDIGGKEMIHGLLKVLESSDLRVRIDTVYGLSSEKALPVLFKALKDAEPVIRYLAVHQLGKIGNETAIPALLGLLQDPNTQVRDQAVHALGNIGNETAIPGLLGLLQDPDAQVCAQAVRALGNIGDETAIPDLLIARHDRNPYIRMEAIRALGKIIGDQVIQELFKAFEDQDFYVRRSAIQTLAELESDRVISALIKALKYSHPEIHESATEALVNMGEKAIPCLLNALNHPNATIRGRTVYVLGQIGSDASIPGLLRALEDPDYDVYARAGYALGLLGNEAAIPGLIKALEHKESSTRWGATYALGQLACEPAIPSLLRALEDSSSSVRAHAAEALGKVKNKVAVKGLLKALSDPNSLVRASAAEALGNIRSMTSLPALLAALDDPKISVRLSVTCALGQLGYEKVVPALLKILYEDHHIYNRRRAVEALGQIQNEEAISGLLKALEKNLEDDVLIEVAVMLLHMGIEIVIPRSQSLTFNLVGILNRIELETAIPALLETLEKDSRLICRKFASQALVKIGSALPLAALWQIQKYKPEEHIWGAISAIQNSCKFYNYEIAHSVTA